MKIFSLLCTISIISSLSLCSITYADTCYDPNYNSYYNCGADEYVAPVVAGLLFGEIIANNNGGRGNYHGNYNRGHGGQHGGGSQHSGGGSQHGGGGRHH